MGAIHGVHVRWSRGQIFTRERGGKLGGGEIREGQHRPLEDGYHGVIYTGVGPTYGLQLANNDRRDNRTQGTRVIRILLFLNPSAGTAVMYVDDVIGVSNIGVWRRT